MGNLILRIEALNAGWADLSITDSTMQVTLSVSHVIGDALSDIMDTAIFLLNGQNSKRTFLLEPDEIAYEVTMINSEEIDLKIGESATICSIQRYVRQVLKMFDTYLYEHSSNDYVAHWKHAFPNQQLEKLRALLYAS